MSQGRGEGVLKSCGVWTKAAERGLECDLDFQNNLFLEHSVCGGGGVVNLYDLNSISPRLIKRNGLIRRSDLVQRLL